MKERCFTIMCLAILFAEASFAVNYAGPGGDMADPANWTGTTLPGTTDAVTFGPTAVPSTGLTLSEPVTFGASTIAEGFTTPLPVNLSGYSYNGAALSVNSDATFQNGFFTNTTLSVAANKTLMLSGAAGQCELKLTSDVATPFGEGSVLHVTEGAILRPGGYRFYPLSSHSILRIDNGATLDCGSMSQSYNLSSFIYGVANVTLVVDNATAKFYTLNVGASESGSKPKSLVRNSLFSFKNGSTVSFSPNTSRGFRLGEQGGYSISNRVEFLDSTISDSSNRGLFVDGICNTVVISNSTGLKITTQRTGRGNSIFLLGKNPSQGETAFSGAVSLGGSTNLYAQMGGTAKGATTVGGTTNRLEMAGGTRTGDVTLKGTNGVFRLSGGIFSAALSMNGVSNVYEQVSGASTGNVTVAGFGNTLYFRSGTHWGQYRQALVFNENTTNNAVVIDNAEFIHHGTFGKSYSDGEGYPYVNCPNCAIEFRGAAPKFRVTSPKQGASSTPWHTVNLGKGTEPMEAPVRLRFILPQEPYAEAPFRSEFSSSHYAVLDGNAVIEVDDSNLPKSHGKLRYPLVYDLGSFQNGSRINVESLSTVNRALGTIGENMTFARDGTTLYVDIKSSGGFVLVVR